MLKTLPQVGPVKAVTWSPDGRWLATGDWARSATLRNPDDGTPVRTLTGHDDWVMDVAFSPDSQLLATGSGDHWRGCGASRAGRCWRP